MLVGIVVCVLSNEPCCLGSLFADKRLARPPPGVEQVSKPLGVVLVYALPLLGQVVGQSASVRIGPGDSQVTGPLIFITPDQQVLPKLLIHAAIALERS